MSTWLLDTNIVGHIIRGDQPDIVRKLVRLPMEDIVISAVTEGELFYGLARRIYPVALTKRVKEFLLRVDVVPWDRDVTKAYGDLRAACEAEGVVLAPIDMMIAAHAVAAGATLVTRDKTFSRVPGPLKTDDWTETGDVGQR
jgi:tRNA(fMet)-specific endonuclease VapC